MRILVDLPPGRTRLPGMRSRWNLGCQQSQIAFNYCGDDASPRNLQQDQSISRDVEFECAILERDRIGSGKFALAVELLNLRLGGITRTAHCPEVRQRIAVSSVHTADKHLGRRVEIAELKSNVLRAAFLLWLDQVPHGDCQCAVGLARHQNVVGRSRETLVSQPVQQSVVIISGFLDATHRDYPEATVE